MELATALEKKDHIKYLDVLIDGKTLIDLSTTEHMSVQESPKVLEFSAKKGTTCL